MAGAGACGFPCTIEFFPFCVLQTLLCVIFKVWLGLLRWHDPPQDLLVVRSCTGRACNPRPQNHVFVGAGGESSQTEVFHSGTRWRRHHCCCFCTKLGTTHSGSRGGNNVLNLQKEERAPAAHNGPRPRMNSAGFGTLSLFVGPRVPKGLGPLT